VQQYKKNLSCFRFVSLLTSLVLLALFSFAHAGEFSFHPSITIAEEYTDNVFETRDNKRSDFITRLMPGIALTYNASLWDWDLRYAYDYRYYARNSRSGDDTHNLDVHGLTRLIKDLFFLDISDVYERTSLDVSRDRTMEGLFVDQSDRNVFIASPYFNFRPVPKTTVRTGYRYRNVWYKEPEGIDRQQHIGFAEATYEYSPKLNLTASYTYTHENSDYSFDRHTPYVGFRYEYKDRSFVFAQVGYTWINMKNRDDFDDPFWNCGITHTMGTYTLSLTTRVSYPEDPERSVTREEEYALTLAKEFSRGNVGLTVSYTDYSGDDVDTEKRYLAGLTARYEIGARLVAGLSAGVERYDDRASNSYTRRIYVNPTLSYPLPKEIFLTLSYLYADYYSPRIYEDNYTLNRVMLEARKTF
jgi:predicted porin